MEGKKGVELATANAQAGRRRILKQMPWIYEEAEGGRGLLTSCLLVGVSSGQQSISSAAYPGHNIQVVLRKRLLQFRWEAISFSFLIHLSLSKSNTT